MTENALHSAARVACRAEAGKLARVAKLLPNGTRPLWRARHLRRGPGLACVVVMFRPASRGGSQAPRNAARVHALADAAGWRPPGDDHGLVQNGKPHLGQHLCPNCCAPIGAAAFSGEDVVTTTPPKIPTGVPGLDNILDGGIQSGRVYLVEGTPGTGKTTLALQFLLAGREQGEPGLTSRCPNRPELHAVAASHGWSLDGIDLFELVSEEGLDPGPRADRAAPVRSGTGRDHARASWPRSTSSRPTRVVFDSLSRNAPAGAEPAALPPPDPGAEAVLHPAQLHRPAARRQNLRPRRPAAAQHRPRRHRAGADRRWSSAPSAAACAS